MVDSLSLKQLNPSDLQVIDVTLLSTDEAEMLPKDLRLCSASAWWLRSIGPHPGWVTFVNGIDGHVDLTGTHADSLLGVRPVLKIGNMNSLGLGNGDRFVVNDITYTVISDYLAFCDDSIGRKVYNNCSVYDKFLKANVFSRSDLKHYIDCWAVEQGFIDSSKVRNFSLVKPSDLCGATILSVDEFDELVPDDLKALPFPSRICSDTRCWLGTSGKDGSRSVAFVDTDGTVNERGVDIAECLAVRPALKLSKDTDLVLGDRFLFGNMEFCVISSDYALCDSEICNEQFIAYVYLPDLSGDNMYARVSNNYEDSFVKASVDNWCSEAFFEQFPFQFAGFKYEHTKNPVYKHIMDMVDSGVLSDKEDLLSELEAADRVYEKACKMQFNRKVVSGELQSDIDDLVKKGIYVFSGGEFDF